MTARRKRKRTMKAWALFNSDGNMIGVRFSPGVSEKAFGDIRPVTITWEEK